MKPSAKDRDVVCDSNIMLLRYLQLLGTYPIPLSRKDDELLNWSWKSPSSLYCFFIISMYAILMFFLNYGLVSQMTDIVDGDVPYMHATMLFVLIPIINIFVIFDSKTVLKYFGEWQYFQVHCQFVTGRIFQLDHKKGQIVYICASMVLSGMLSAYACDIMADISVRNNVQYDAIYSYIYAFLMGYASCVIFGMWGLWWYLLKTIRGTADQLLLAFHESNNSIRSILEYRLLWRELRELTCGLSGAFNTSLLVYIVYGFTASMGCWYATMTTTIGTFSFNVFISSFVTLFITSIPEYCYRTSLKVGASVQRVISNIRRKGANDEVEKQLMIFEICIVQFPPNFAVAGCFTLNRNFSITVFINYAQAMVIIYQLKSST